ncbi:helix-turn-helix domain-containing protein [Lutispora sp.]|uniref:helix-turn-helix domain-containing protein n=1 Tax=Lutispora sp. TaxID=2828727 RepID=UPI002B21404E|nr:helix-turn-helix transcriptional regulator [Lutispora sp.]MEA4962810.1 helix-turn-helix transcriptional regulator [Lutispora sp.]
MSFGEKLAMLRGEKNMSRNELAKILNISYSSISKYETEIRFPDQDMLRKIADYFQVSTDYLLGRTDVRYFYDEDEAGEISSVSETASYHDFNKDELPEEAIKQINDYIEFIKQKYNSDSK